MDSGESLCCQFLALEVFPEATHVFSAFHAGLGQVTFGPDRRQKADCLISLETTEGVRSLRYFNYHGLYFHRNGLHMPNCRRKPSVVEEIRRIAGKTYRARHEEKIAYYWMFLNQRREEEGGQTAKSPPPPPPPPSFPRDLERITAGEYRLWADYLEREEREQCHKYDDELKSCYALALSKVDPSSLTVSYQVINECELLHEKTPPNPMRWSQPGKRRAEEEEGQQQQQRKRLKKNFAQYSDLREFLKCEHGEDSVLGIGRRMQFSSQEELVAKILDSGYNSVPGQEFGGFVVITGGRETRKGDILPRQMGFCHQRCSLSPAQVGSFTRMQAEMQWGKKGGKEFVKRLSSNKGTLCRTSFHEGGEAISCDYFRFLLLERGFEDYTVRHFMYYTYKHFLDAFIEGMLQRRHTLKLENGPPLMREFLKLAINGTYGFFSIEAPNFPRTRIVRESYLKKMSFEARLGMGGKDVTQVSLLGAVHRKGTTPDLLYAITSRKPEDKIFNLIQVACAILSQSRNIFLGKILTLLRCFDPRKLELAYTGERYIERYRERELGFIHVFSLFYRYGFCPVGNYFTRFFTAGETRV